MQKVHKAVRQQWQVFSVQSQGETWQAALKGAKFNLNLELNLRSWAAGHVLRARDQQEVDA